MEKVIIELRGLGIVVLAAVQIAFSDEGSRLVVASIGHREYREV